jgi:signal transduction histidine kinase
MTYDRSNSRRAALRAVISLITLGAAPEKDTGKYMPHPRSSRSFDFICASSRQSARFLLTLIPLPLKGESLAILAILHRACMNRLFPQLPSASRSELFSAWACARQITLVRAIAARIITLNLPFHLILLRIPDLPPERLSLRLLPMAAAALSLLLVASPRLRSRANLIMLGLMATQLCSSGVHVAESLNAPIYVAACLTPLYASQLAFVYLADLLICLVTSSAFYLAACIATGAVKTPNDLVAIMLIFAASLIASILGAIRIRSIDHEFSAREALANKSEQLQQAEARALAAAAEASAANLAKSNFLANMSHELRTPLNVITGYSELIAEVAREDGFTHILPDLDRISSASTHLVQLINTLLDLSKIEAGRMDLVPTQFPLSALLDELHDMGQVLAARQGNTLHVASCQPAATLTTDRLKLRQILLNLLSNAAKFTRSGSLWLELVEEDPEQISLIVRDSGAGMSPAQIERLFQPFAQVHDASLREEVGGTGLGLVLCRRLATLLGGQLDVTSSPGQGSSFIVTIPRAITAAAAPDAPAHP